MSDGVLYKANGTTWTKSKAMKGNGSVMSDGVVKHSNGVSWYDNYPMEQSYQQDFGVQWTQGYNSAGTKLYAPTWGDHIYTGGGDGFRSYIGFDKNAISAFVTATGVITKVEILVNLRETSLNGHPTTKFVPHQAASAPTSWNATIINMTYVSEYTFPNDSDSAGLGGYWKTLTANHIKHPTTGVFFNGIALVPTTNTEEDWGVFTGKSGFNSILRITVTK